jgi:predicted 2-oxoglutarate/Fe(II)-dependent dioxygenase YbiX
MTCLILPDFLGIAECVRVRTAMDGGCLSCAEIYADGYRVDEGIRRTFDVDVDDEIVAVAQRAIDAVRPRVAGFFDVPLVGEEGPGFLRYAPGGFYRTHRDVAPGLDAAFPRRISVVLFLTTAGSDAVPGRCEGGSLRVYDEVEDRGESGPLDIAPAAGTLVAFPSTLLHEVLPVTAGVRDVIVDWFY